MCFTTEFDGQNFIQELHLTDLFPRKALGVDGDREITREEFIKKGVQSSFLKSMMKN